MIQNDWWLFVSAQSPKATLYKSPWYKFAWYCYVGISIITRRHNERDGVLIHRRLDRLLNCFPGAVQRKKQSSASLAFVWGNPPVTGGFPSQRVSKTENVFMWWCHHDVTSNLSGNVRSQNDVYSEYTDISDTIEDPSNLIIQIHFQIFSEISKLKKIFTAWMRDILNST